MPASPQTYARLALDQIPRLLGNMDRNPLSSTYGCCHRDYWLEKTSDFPDAVRQFAAHALALVYRHPFPDSPYRGQPKIRDWAVAAVDYWAGLQHREGSFDEFYPYERGWVGPTAFTTYTAVETCRLLGDELPADVRERVHAAVARAAAFIARGESEEDHLANHHAMACLAVWKAYQLLGDEALLEGFQERWRIFLTYHHADEGWSREYDGVDPGYLSATVSFLAKIYQDHPLPEMLEVMQQSAAFCAYFAYPNGYYAGSLGSRNTLHFYPHGFEVLAPDLPLAAGVAERMLEGLEAGALVPPGIMSDRYVVYRVPEFLLAALDYRERPTEQPPLPSDSPGLDRFFPGARVAVRTDETAYSVANLGKGGMLKVFRRTDGVLVVNDCGIVGSLPGGRTMTSQWIDPDYSCSADATGYRVVGRMHVVPSNKLFTPFKHVIFRGVLILLGWHPGFAHWLKGMIRKSLILQREEAPMTFERTVTLGQGTVEICDEIRPTADAWFDRLMIGDEFFVRYVPQSRYFQGQELGVSGWAADDDLLAQSKGRGLRVRRTVDITSGTVRVTDAQTL